MRLLRKHIFLPLLSLWILQSKLPEFCLSENVGFLTRSEVPSILHGPATRAVRPLPLKVEIKLECRVEVFF